MFLYKATRELLIQERGKNAQLRAVLEKTNADVEYIAMMADVELEEEPEDEENGAE